MVDKSVPVLITWDIDPDLWIPLDERIQRLQMAVELCNELDIRATFFFTASSAYVYANAIEKMMTQGHEIGCHGLTHGNEEDYNQMPEDMQRAYIEQATEKLEDLVSIPIRVFRSPRVKTTATTLRLLMEHGYLADSSVCSQRVDLISSNLINFNWFFSPRRPYHPRQDNAFKRGEVPIWEMPISAAFVPFISSALRLLGLSFMKIFFRLLVAESKLTGKPIIYLAHPTEFAVSAKGPKRSTTFRERWVKHVKPKYFTPSFIRTHGFRFRNLLHHMDGNTLFGVTQQLFNYMTSFTCVKFMTVGEYAMYLNDRDSFQ
jgi:peptidoglycan/xylan/chitin deacetylase (PgdA/CDA1 family)